jgi:SM-20-related protein
METTQTLDEIVAALLGAPPGPKAPQAALDRVAAAAGIALARRLLDRPGLPPPAVAQQPAEPVQPARFLILEEFLAPAELSALQRYAERREPHFTTSRVISPTKEAGVIDYQHRRSRLDFEVGEHHAVLVERLLSCLPLVRERLALPPFDVARFEVQMTASNDGDYFKVHNDNTHPALVGRELTFVYFFHREPKSFTGGGLRLHDSRWNGTRYEAAGGHRTILPEQNQIVFFPSFFMHEIAEVRCPSRAFGDGRFTLNGWIHKRLAER